MHMTCCLPGFAAAGQPSADRLHTGVSVGVWHPVSDRLLQQSCRPNQSTYWV